MSPIEEPHYNLGVCHPNSNGHTEAWESITPIQGATPKQRSPLPQMEGPYRSVGVHHPNSRGHAEAWESITPTQGVIPNSRGHTEVWNSINTTPGATSKIGSPSPQLEGPRRSMGVREPN